MINRVRQWYRRRKYKVGIEMSRFIARDVKRDVVVVSCDQLDQGVVTVKIKTNNLLGLSKGLIEPEEYSDPVVMRIDDLWKWSGPSWGERADGRSISDAAMTLEEQIETLASIGLVMNEGVTIEDLLYSWDRSEYENDPFHEILFMYGTEIEREPWGRFISNCAWNLDMECIDDPGSYIDIVNNLARISGQSSAISNVKDYVNLEAKKAWVSYDINGVSKRLDAKVDYDWADPNVVMLILKDLKQPGYRFYALDNGQSSIWYYLNKEQAKKLNDLTNGALSAY